MTRHSLLDKGHGCLAGLALGDALGCPTEFLTPEQIAAEYGWVERLVTSPTWHPHAALPIGRVTDDTEQALALAGVYLRDGQMSAEAMARAVLDWADVQGEHRALYLGPSTQKALESLRAGADPRESGRAGRTNGAAMRVAPVGIVRAGRSANCCRASWSRCGRQGCGHWNSSCGTVTRTGRVFCR